MIYNLIGLAALLTQILASPISTEDGIVLTTPSITLCSESESGDVTIHGSTDGLIDSYLGVPFAAPPVGDLRFVPTQDLQWSSTQFNATQRAPACLQAPNDFYTTLGVSEDCLYLDINVPSSLPSNASLPVLFWVYGGSFVSGASGFYDGTWIVNQSIHAGQPLIFVAVNYRLGIFGFPYGKEAAEAGAANLGLRDVMKGLEWVQGNIESFGGDPSRVTVFGESAGAIIISQLMLQTNITNLFSSAIMQSGAASSIPMGPTESTWQEPYDLLAAFAGCDGSASNNITAGGDDKDEECYDSSFECLKSLTGQELLGAQEQVRNLTQYQAAFPFSPSIDGDLIPDSPYTLIEQGRFAQLPFISGNMKDEGTYFVPPSLPQNETLAMQFLSSLEPVPPPPDIIAKVFSLYSDDPSEGSPFGTGNETFEFAPLYKKVSAIFGDAYFQAPRRFLLTEAVDQKRTGFWSYQMDAVIPALPAYLGAFHSADIPYTFGLPQIVFAGITGPIAERAATYNFTLADVKLSEQMINYWINFAYHANPNGKGNATTLPSWPEYGAEGEGNMIQLNIKEIEVIEDTFRKDQIDYLLEHPVDFSY